MSAGKSARLSIREIAELSLFCALMVAGKECLRLIPNVHPVTLLLLLATAVYGAKALYPAFGLCYMMTITFQTVGASKMGLFLSLIRQGLFYIPFILILPSAMGVTGIYLSQPAADALTTLACVFLMKPMKRIASRRERE